MTFFGTPQVPAEKAVLPALGTTPIDLKLSRDGSPGIDAAVVLAQGLRDLYAKAELCDLAFEVGGGRLLGHRAVLAAASPPFADFLRRPESADLRGLFLQVPPSEIPEAALPTEAAASSEAPVDAAVSSSPGSSVAVPRPLLELSVDGVDGQAMRIVLDYAYVAGTGCSWEYEPSTAAVNRDVLRLSGRLNLPTLREHAARWLVKGLTTANVVDRLVTCEELGLGKLRERMLQHLIASPAQLAAVVDSPGIMEHPRLLQDLLVQVATSCASAPLAPAAPAAQAAPAAPASGSEDKEVPAEDTASEKAQEKAQDKPAQKPDGKKRKKGAC